MLSSLPFRFHLQIRAQNHVLSVQQRRPGVFATFASQIIPTWYFRNTWVIHWRYTCDTQEGIWKMDKNTPLSRMLLHSSDLGVIEVLSRTCHSPHTSNHCAHFFEHEQKHRSTSSKQHFLFILILTQMKGNFIAEKDTNTKPTSQSKQHWKTYHLETLQSCKWWRGQRQQT
jgi:hypothetical protein